MFRTTITRRVLAPRFTPTASSSRTTTIIARPFSQRTQLQAAKDSQNKDTLKPESNEYSKTGSDNAAAQGDTAFDPSTTSPEAQEASAEKESGSKKSSLNVSPANADVSKPPKKEGGHEGSSAESGKGNSDRARTSGGGSPAKGGEGKKYSS